MKRRFYTVGDRLDDLERELMVSRGIALTGGSGGGGGGGGGSVAWTAVTGKPATFPPESHTHTGVYEAAGAAAAAVLAHESELDPHPGYLTAAEADVSYAAASHSHAGLPVAGSFSVTVPVWAYSHEQTVSATGVTAGMRVLLAVAPHADTDDNHETMLDVAALAAEAGTDQITVRMGFLSQTVGAIRLNFMAV